MTNLLTYGMDVKVSSLINQGWQHDTANNMESVSANIGLKTRCGWFRKDFSTNNDWRLEGFQMIGRLNHELMGVDKSMPPGNQSLNYKLYFLISSKFIYI